jgi:hypothetical protein
MGDGEARDSTGVKLAEIERLINEFKEKFEAGTSDAENFMTMFEIEQLWLELQNGTNNVYSDMVRELMSTVDERGLIRKKKRISTPQDNTAPHCFSEAPR